MNSFVHRLYHFKCNISVWHVLDKRKIGLCKLCFAAKREVLEATWRPRGSHCVRRREREGHLYRYRMSGHGTAQAHLHGKRQWLRHAPRPLPRPCLPEVTWFYLHSMSTTNVYMQYSLVQPDALISTGESEEAFYLPETFGSQNKVYQKRGFRENKPKFNVPWKQIFYLRFR